MGSFSIWHWIIVLIVVVIVFGGRGRISSIMSDIGKGLRNLRSEIDKNENDKKDKDDSKEK
jgi:sec-independent protein translocase protein TatA